MTIRRRLALAFVAVLVLMGVNQVIFVWSSRLRTQTVQTLDRALTRQVIISNVQREVDNLHKEVTLLSQVEEGAGVADAEARALFNAKVDRVGLLVKELRELADPLDAEAIYELDQTYSQLAVAWKSFYQYLGASQGLLLAELVRADPLSQRLLMTTLPRLESDQQARVEEAKAASASVTARTNALSLGIFGLSTLVSGILALLVAHHITRRIGDLNFGTAMIGMSLEHRLDVKGKDELAALGRAFNDMAEKLQAARGELTAANEELATRNSDLDKERQVSESLLLNILPSQVAVELETKGSVEPRYYEDVTVVFTDFAGFTLATEKLAAEDLVRILNGYFTAFDEISNRYGLEKLKTIGDSYLAVGGMPVRTPSHPVDAVLAAFEIVEAVRQQNLRDPLANWSVRVGIHTGAVVAGVVGTQKFAFDVWGETVNFASRIESAGSAGQINVSGATYLRIKDFFECEHRGKVLTKEQREVDMYFVRGLQLATKGDDGEIPPPSFVRRYRTYFQKDPASFPASLVDASDVSSLRSTSQT